MYLAGYIVAGPNRGTDPVFSRLHGAAVRGSPIGDGAGAASGGPAGSDPQRVPKAASRPPASASTATTAAAAIHHIRREPAAGTPQARARAA